MVNIKKAESIYKRSIEILKEVQLKNGGCLATPKGERYPYVYPRDHSICTLGFLAAKLYDRAKKALSFVLSNQLKSGAFPQRYDVHGRDASYKPIQIDGTALIIYSFCRYIEKTKDLEFAKQHWYRLLNAANYIINNIHEKGLVYTPNSIHEFPPIEQGLEIWANSVCCAALRELNKLSKLLKYKENFNLISKRIKRSILKYMWNSRIKGFVKNIRIKESSSVETYTDASTIGLVEFNIIPDKDKRVISTIKNIERDLWNPKLGGICRYPKYEGRNNGGYGPWPHFTLMVCKHFIRRKNKLKADKYLNWVINIAYNNELPEHISTKEEFEEYVIDFSEAGLLRKDRLIMIKNARKHKMFKKGLAYITIPLAWPHAEFIRTWNLYKNIFNPKI